MPNREPSRKALFRAACAYAHTTPNRFRQERGFTTTTFYEVLNGRRFNADIESAVDAFIAEHAPAPAASAAA